MREAPAVAAGEAIRADDAVAGDEDGDGVFADGVADGSGGFGKSYVPGDVGVGGGLGERDFEQCFPDHFLEECAGGGEG